MKTISYSLFFILALLAATGAHAADSMLRVTCAGDDVGAEIFVNGQLKGECPLEIRIESGTIQLKLFKKIDDSRERVFEQTFSMSDGDVKKVEAVLSARPSLAAQKLEDQRLAVERAEAALHDAENRAAFNAALASGAMQATLRDCADCPEMVAIPPGSFETESNNGDAGENPVRRFTLAKAFAMGKTEITQGQWRAIMGNNPSRFSRCGDNCPVEKVSWDDAQVFIQKLNAKTGKHYRLPSEVEWEYACRAGVRQEYCGSDDVDSVAWSATNSGFTPHPVGGKQANAFGLYDMSGNVWEWVEDSYHNSYHGAPADGSAWQGDGARRVARGGSWYLTPQCPRAANRCGDVPDDRVGNVGFRLARTLP